jgi:multidrug efflux system outer membrane protein
MIGLVAAGIAVAVVLGCAQPPDRVPPARLDMVIPDSFATSAGDGRPVTGEWWRELGDDALVRAIGRALERNPTLQAAAARIDQARAAARLAGAGNLPSVGASVSASHGQAPAPTITGGTSAEVSSSYGLSLNVSWEPDLWGRVRAGESAAMADVQAAQARLRGAKLSLIGQVAKVWFAATEARMQIRLAEETLDNFTTSLARIEARFENGVLSPLDVRLARLNVATSEALVNRRRLQFDSARRQLEILLGDYPAGEIAAATDLPDVTIAVPAGLPSDLLRRRPDLVAVERQLAAADARIDEARAAFFPSLSFSASFGQRSGELDTLFDPQQLVWNLAANLLAPIFERGTRFANLDLRNAQSRELVATYANAVLGAFAETEIALASESLLAARAKALTTAEEEALAAQDLAENRYNRGLAGIITLLSAQRDALNTRSQLLTVRRERLDARIDLYLALGGGFEAESLYADERELTPNQEPVSP